MKLEYIVIFIVMAGLVVIAPSANPDFNNVVGGVLAPPMEFVGTFLGTVFDGLGEFDVEFWQWLKSTGVSIPLTLAIVALIKPLAWFKQFKAEKLATAVGFTLVLVMYVAQQYGFESQHDMVVRVTVAILAVVTGGAGAQFGASWTHEKTVDSPLTLSYHRVSDKGAA